MDGYEWLDPEGSKAHSLDPVAPLDRRGAHEVTGGELTLASDRLWFVVRVLPAHGRAALTLEEAYRRNEDGAIELPIDSYSSIEFRSVWHGSELVLSVTMGPPTYAAGCGDVWT